MAKATSTVASTAPVEAAADVPLDPRTNGWVPADPRVMPRMGETVMVMAQPDTLLRNNETGGYIAAGTPTPQTVTVTLLRRLQDGDLVLLAPAAG